MGHLDESNQTSEDLNATTSNSNEAIVHPAIAHDESTQISSNKKSISSSPSSSSISSHLSLQDLQILDGETHNENMSDSGSPTIQIMERPETIPSHFSSRKIFTSPDNWSMASNESLFSIRMGGNSFCHLDSFSPLFELPYDSQSVDGKILETDMQNNQYEEDKGNRFSATSNSSRSSSNSLVFPVLSGEENGGSPDPRGALIGPVPQPPPKPEPRSNPESSGAEVEAKETTTFIAWTVWFPCFRYCACCS